MLPPSSCDSAVLHVACCADVVFMLMTLPFEGPYYPSFPILLALNGVQFALWYFVQNYVDSYLVMGLLAWFNSCTLFYSLSTFIHENSHGLILGKCEIARRPSTAACLCSRPLPRCPTRPCWRWRFLRRLGRWPKRAVIAMREYSLFLAYPLSIEC